MNKEYSPEQYSSPELDDETAGESYVSLDLVGHYLNEIGKIARLNAEDEVELAKDIEAGLYAQKLLEQERFDSVKEMAALQSMREIGEQAKQRFISANLRLVVSIAKRYTGKGMPFMDLIQEGNTGLIKAVENFDYTKGFKFSTNATRMIWKAIIVGMFAQSRSWAIPLKMGEKMNKLGNLRRTMTQELGRNPMNDELAEEMGMSVKELMDFINECRDAVSLDMKVGEEDDGMTLGYFVEDCDAERPGDALIIKSLRHDVDELLSRISEDERTILRGRFGIGNDGMIKNSSVIGKELGISKNAVDDRYGTLMARLACDEQVKALAEYLR